MIDVATLSVIRRWALREQLSVESQANVLRYDQLREVRYAS